MSLSRPARLRRTVRVLFWTPVTLAAFAWALASLVHY